MNERIKELAEQVYGSAHYDDFKFAELIIRECTEVAEEVSPGETTYGWMVAQKIKEHFGVEE